MSGKLEVVDPQESFQDFLKMEKYRQRISQMSIIGTTSLVIDFEDLLSFDQKLAKMISENPDECLKHVRNAAFTQLQIEDPEYAERMDPEQLAVRIVKLLEHAILRKLGSRHIGKLVMIPGIIVRSTPVRPMVMTGY